MNPKHTPGPWQVAGESIITKNDQFCIAVIEDDGGYEAPPEQREANARLIAAAPDLLDCLKMFCIEHTNPCGCENCRIIAVAEGTARKRKVLSCK